MTVRGYRPNAVLGTDEAESTCFALASPLLPLMAWASSCGFGRSSGRC
jgi:hypothetical protein